jgi:hypothetical protein
MKYKKKFKGGALKWYTEQNFKNPINVNIKFVFCSGLSAMFKITF